MIVLGSVNFDLVVRLQRLPGPGETVTGGTLAQHHGGKGANQAVAAARLGAQVEFVGAVGNDDFGSSARDDLMDEGVGLDGLRVIEDVATGAALIMVAADGENQIAVASGANAAFDETIWHGAPALRHTDVYLANFEVPDEAVVAGAVAATEARATVLINPAPARELPAALLTTQPVLVPNEHEAQALTGEFDAVAAARVLAARSGAPVVVTLGAQGAVLVQEGEVERIPAPIVEAVDTTGAGDTFVGALAAELSDGESLFEAVRFAVHAASLSVLRPGARDGMPTRVEVERSLRGEQ